MDSFGMLGILTQALPRYHEYAEVISMIFSVPGSGRARLGHPDHNLHADSSKNYAEGLPMTKNAKDEDEMTMDITMIGAMAF